MTKTERVLRFIGRGKAGRTLTEIQKFIVEMNGLNWEERDRNGKRRYRGYWCDYLLDTYAWGMGGVVERPGVLSKHCARFGNRYVIRK